MSEKPAFRLLGKCYIAVMQCCNAVPWSRVRRVGANCLLAGWAIFGSYIIILTVKTAVDYWVTFHRLGLNSVDVFYAMEEALFFFFFVLFAGLCLPAFRERKSSTAFDKKFNVPVYHENHHRYVYGAKQAPVFFAVTGFFCLLISAVFIPSRTDSRPELIVADSVACAQREKSSGVNGYSGLQRYLESYDSYRIIWDAVCLGTALVLAFAISRVRVWCDSEVLVYRRRFYVLWFLSKKYVVPLEELDGTSFSTGYGSEVRLRSGERKKVVLYSLEQSTSWMSNIVGELARRESVGEREEFLQMVATTDYREKWVAAKFPNLLPSQESSSS